MSVEGIEKFKQVFSKYSDFYVLIGGSACDLLAQSIDERFRATKDLDIVILTDMPKGSPHAHSARGSIAEASSAEKFAKTLWNFIEKGKYSAWTDKHDAARFYRFEKPKTSGYPHMIELFARNVDFLLKNEQAHIRPLHMGDEVSSLSAIILDDNYYEFIKSGATVLDGLSILDAIHLIPLKMRAHIDLNKKKRDGMHINEADLKKHRKDVVRLLNFIPPVKTLPLPKKLKSDALEFLETLDDPNFHAEQVVPGISNEMAYERIAKMYLLGENTEDSKAEK